MSKQPSLLSFFKPSTGDSKGVASPKTETNSGKVSKYFSSPSSNNPTPSATTSNSPLLSKLVAIRQSRSPSGKSRYKRYSSLASQEDTSAMDVEPSPPPAFTTRRKNKKLFEDKVFNS